jgi:hypothetical protein
MERFSIVFQHFWRLSAVNGVWMLKNQSFSHAPANSPFAELRAACNWAAQAGDNPRACVFYLVMVVRVVESNSQ